MSEGIGDWIRKDIEEGRWPMGDLATNDLATSDPAAKKSKDLLTAIPKWTAIILAVGAIIGTSVLITVGIKAVEAQNEALKQTQHEALHELESQREVFDREQKSLSTQLAEAKKQLAQAKDDALAEANQSLSKLREEADQALAEVESALKSQAATKSHRPQARSRISRN